MKKIFRNNRVIAVAFLTLFSAAAAPASMANDSSRIPPVIPVELKYTGMIKNDPLFQLSVAGNPQQDDFTISISDLDGNNLYREHIRGENFTKNFLLNTEELGDEILRFEITSRKTKQVLVYEISSRTRMVRETAVSLVR